MNLFYHHQFYSRVYQYLYYYGLCVSPACISASGLEMMFMFGILEFMMYVCDISMHIRCWKIYLSWVEYSWIHTACIEIYTGVPKTGNQFYNQNHLLMNLIDSIHFSIIRQYFHVYENNKYKGCFYILGLKKKNNSFKIILLFSKIPQKHLYTFTWVWTNCRRSFATEWNEKKKRALVSAGILRDWWTFPGCNSKNIPK